MEVVKDAVSSHKTGGSRTPSKASSSSKKVVIKPFYAEHVNQKTNDKILIKEPELATITVPNEQAKTTDKQRLPSARR